MRKINRMDILRIMLVLTLVAGAGLALGSVGRFTPTHKIVEAVNCISCHPEQAEELSATTHLTHFAREVNNFYFDNTGYQLTDAESITGGCTMCHNYWDNMKWFGSNYFIVEPYDFDNPEPIYDNEPYTGTGSGGTYYGVSGYPAGAIGQYLDPDKATDIYGNAVSNYGLGSTVTYLMRLGHVEPWTVGIDEYTYQSVGTDGVISADDETNYRVDYIWSALSSISPGPAAFVEIDPGVDGAYGTADDTVIEGCSNAEKGLCHIAAEAVALSANNQKLEAIPTADVGNDGVLGTADDGCGLDGVCGPDPVTGINDDPIMSGRGNGVFFQHEMAYTTAQYAAKPVKLCGACHVFKLPPMVWGGEAWASMDIKYASSMVRAGPNTDRNDVDEPTALFTEADQYADPFGFAPTYNDNTGEFHNINGRAPDRESFDIRYRTPDWAHMNVPCIRCHSHAGITGETVSSNK